ncbi:MAG: polysaccharide biosynthesis/export family protein [Bryobacteraceae bacterium]|jgi:polysaccharide export outer membrane protein
MLSPRCLLILFMACAFATAQTRETPQATVISGVSVTPAASATDGDDTQTYILGPEDRLTVKVLDLDEISDKDVYRVDMRGNLNLPVAGRVHVAGLTVEQAETEIESRFKAILQNPEVTLSVNEFRPEPVSVLGAVRNPGVVQVVGRKTLYEVLSLAGGLNADASNTIKVTRAKKSGPLPLPNAVDDSTGQYRVAELNVRAVMEAQNPEENIPVLPHDVISVPRADLVYVIGAVKKSGGFVLSEREQISVLQALSLAEGLDRMAAGSAAKILRPVGSSKSRVEIPVNLKKLLQGKGDDVPLLANDILFVPTSASKNVALRTLEAAISIGSGIAIYARP